MPLTSDQHKSHSKLNLRANYLDKRKDYTKLKRLTEREKKLNYSTSCLQELSLIGQEFTDLTSLLLELFIIGLWWKRTGSRVAVCVSVCF